MRLRDESEEREGDRGGSVMDGGRGEETMGKGKCLLGKWLTTRGLDGRWLQRNGHGRLQGDGEEREEMGTENERVGLQHPSRG